MTMIMGVFKINHCKPSIKNTFYNSEYNLLIPKLIFKSYLLIIRDTRSMQRECRSNCDETKQADLSETCL